MTCTRLRLYPVVADIRTVKRVRLYVRDYGSGIPAEERSGVFNVFVRGTMTQPSKGTGLGLAIVKKVARTFGGDAWCEETPGGGCTTRLEMATEA